MKTRDEIAWARLADDFLSEAAMQLENSRTIRQYTPNSPGTTIALLKAMWCVRCARNMIQESDLALGSATKGRRAR